MKPKWLNRYGAFRMPYMQLCLSRKELEEAAKHIKTVHPPDEPWCDPCGAMAHFYTSENKGLVAFICVERDNGLKPEEVAAMLVHEAVHVVQRYMESIGEKEPSKEFQAYCTQWVSQQLFFEYSRRLQELLK